MLFVAAGITDMLDGYLARRDGQVSKLGEFLGDAFLRQRGILAGDRAALVPFCV